MSGLVDRLRAEVDEDAGPAARAKAMDLKNIIEHHRYEAEHAKRLRALVSADFHIKAAPVLEEIERRSGEAIIEGE